jgi:hypothetical protein
MGQDGWGRTMEGVNLSFIMSTHVKVTVISPVKLLHTNKKKQMYYKPQKSIRKITLNNKRNYNKVLRHVKQCCGWMCPKGMSWKLNPHTTVWRDGAMRAWLLMLITKGSLLLPPRHDARRPMPDVAPPLRLPGQSVLYVLPSLHFFCAA